MNMVETNKDAAQVSEERASTIPAVVGTQTLDFVTEQFEKQSKVESTALNQWRTHVEFLKALKEGSVLDWDLLPLTVTATALLGEVFPAFATSEIHNELFDTYLAPIKAFAGHRGSSVTADELALAVIYSIEAGCSSLQTLLGIEDNGLLPKSRGEDEKEEETDDFSQTMTMSVISNAKSSITLGESQILNKPTTETRVEEVTDGYTKLNGLARMLMIPGPTSTLDSKGE